MSRALVVLMLIAGVAIAQSPSDRLRDGNAAAAAGDWPRVAQIVDPLFRMQLPRSDLGEAHRLAGLAAYFQKNLRAAETHFLSYLQIDLDGRLDPSLYPPDVVSFFQDVQVRHAAELRARRPKQKRYWLLNLIPPGGQIQNGERTKAVVIGSLLGGFAAANVASFLVLRRWCTRVQGEGGDSVTCDEKRDRSNTASQLRVVNWVSGAGLIITYLYGVYDGVHGYRRRETIPFVAPASGGGVVGISRAF
jgi:hypothetical protein